MKSIKMSPNEKKLFELLIEILLIDEDQFRDDYGPNEIETWDSLASVSIAAGVEKEFGYAMSPEEIALMDSIGDIKQYLRLGGIDFKQ